MSPLKQCTITVNIIWQFVCTTLQILVAPHFNCGETDCHCHTSYPSTQCSLTIINAILLLCLSQWDLWITNKTMYNHDLVQIIDYDTHFPEHVDTRVTKHVVHNLLCFFCGDIYVSSLQKCTCTTSCDNICVPKHVHPKHTIWLNACWT